MKKISKKVISICLCAAVTCGIIGTAVYAASSGEDGADISDQKEEASNQADAGTQAIEKNETVYVIAGADGSAKKIIVSDWIKNTLGDASITDSSELTDIENVKGNESYTMNGSNMQVWDAEGNDIYYQGKIEKELPVDLSVSYQLDGSAISPEELAGKSGRVTIRFDYKNNQYETVEIDGKQETVYVPFAMLTGTILNNDVFTNVEITNGKLINDGDRTIVVGIAFPGLQDNLALDQDSFEIPDYIEIHADVKNFEMTATMTVASNEGFNQLDAVKLDDFDSLSDSLGELSDAMEQLIDGSAQLYEGLDTLLEQSGSLIAGINQLADGSGKVKDGAAALKDGAAALNGGANNLKDGASALKNGADALASGASQLNDGASALSGGLNTLTANNSALNGGAKQVFESLLSTADSQIAAAGITIPKLTIENYAQVLDGVIATLDQAAAYKPEANAAAASIRALKGQLDSYREFYNGLLAYTSGVSDAANGAANLKNGAASLNEGAKSLKNGAAELQSGAETLTDGTTTLLNGAADLSSGTDELYDGILSLQNGSSTLTEGVSALREGALTLNSGLKEFNEEGVQKLVNAIDGDLNGLITRLRATSDVSKRYQSFSGISEEMDGQVKFIYRTESIKSTK